MSTETPASWSLRVASVADCRMFWEWANDPQVRAMAFHSEPIPWESHQRWFAARLASSASHLFVLEDKAQIAAGQVRFDQASEGVFEIDISVAPAQRGRGAGLMLIQLGEQALCKSTSVKMLRALVKKENAASLALFRRAGYQDRGITLGPGSQEAVLLEKNP